MNRNSFIDAWLALSRGQRRATVVLVAVIVVMAILQVGISYHKGQRRDATAEYSVLQQEIALFRSQADSVLPVDDKHSYVRHTRVVPDTVGYKPQNASSQRVMQPVPRIGEE